MERHLPAANSFQPHLWLNSDSEATTDWALVPFSEGPVRCPGRELVLLLTSAMLAAMLRTHAYRLTDTSRLETPSRLPGNLNPFTLLFDVTAQK